MSDPLAAGEWVLYGAEASPYFLKIEMVLRFLQIPYRRVPEHGSFRETLYYRRRTALVRKGLVSLTWPQMTEFDEFPAVPYLYGPNDEVLYDSSAIVRWLDKRRGSSRGASCQPN